MLRESKKNVEPCNESGQTVLLITVVIMSFLLFFSFVINTGILVTAKISLQTAADTAAYAGAATQARYLNSISYLNYDMRRQFKKFTFKYVFMGNYAKQAFPQPVDNSPNTPDGYYSFPMLEITNGNSPPSAYYSTYVPSVCVPLTSKQDDSCQTLSIPNQAKVISGGATLVMDSLGQTLINQLQAISDKIQDICQGRGALNKVLAFQWLFRGSLNRDQFRTQIETLFSNSNVKTQPNANEIDQLINNTAMLTDNIGVFPKNLYTYMRIKTLEQFLNTPPQKEVTNEKAAQLQKIPEAEIYERTLQAYRSAYSNLNRNIFSNSEKIIMDELQAPQQISLDMVSIPKMMIYVVDSGPAAKGSSQNCPVAIKYFQVPLLPVGVTRKPGIPTHYAVKLQAEATLFAAPKNITLDLSAVAAAEPFGSRIGPAQQHESDYVVDMSSYLTTGGQPYYAGNVLKVKINNCDETKNCYSPNLKIVEGGNIIRTFTQSYMNEIWSKAKAASSSGAIDANVYAKGLQLVTAPSTVEIGQYNIIPPPPKTDSDPNFMYDFIPYWSSSDQAKLGNSSIGIYRFYAPVYAQTGSADPKDVINKMLDDMYSKTSVGTPPDAVANDQQIRTEILNGMNEYLNQLKNPKGPPATENNESVTFAAIELPMQSEMEPSPSKYWLTQAKEVLSSWGPSYTRGQGGLYGAQMPAGFQPRFGFSVKFVSFGTLLKQGMPEPTELGDFESLEH